MVQVFYNGVEVFNLIPYEEKSLNEEGVEVVYKLRSHLADLDSVEWRVLFELASTAEGLQHLLDRFDYNPVIDCYTIDAEGDYVPTELN